MGNYKYSENDFLSISDSLKADCRLGERVVVTPFAREREQEAVCHATPFEKARHRQSPDKAGKHKPTSNNRRIVAVTLQSVKPASDPKTRKASPTFLRAEPAYKRTFLELWVDKRTSRLTRFRYPGAMWIPFPYDDGLKSFHLIQKLKVSSKVSFIGFMGPTVFGPTSRCQCATKDV
uniref:Uncharacterized protein n=1 Tax=Moniliophthora roreri TaxID=221103 RepID=A0A0W0G3G9_MONRR